MLRSRSARSARRSYRLKIAHQAAKRAAPKGRPLHVVELNLLGRRRVVVTVRGRRRSRVSRFGWQRGLAGGRGRHRLRRRGRRCGLRSCRSSAFDRRSGAELFGIPADGHAGSVLLDTARDGHATQLAIGATDRQLLAGRRRAGSFQGAQRSAVNASYGCTGRQGQSLRLSRRGSRSGRSHRLLRRGRRGGGSGGRLRSRAVLGERGSAHQKQAGDTREKRGLTHDIHLDYASGRRLATTYKHGSLPIVSCAPK